MGTFIRSPCIYCGANTITSSGDGRNPDHEVICSKKKCRKAHPRKSRDGTQEWG